MIAWLNLRHPDSERASAFRIGLSRLGYRISDGLPARHGPNDLFCTWNLLRGAKASADHFEAEGLPVVVVENSLWGNDFLGDSWLSLSLGIHNTAGRFPVGGPERWDSLGVKLAPWRTAGETVVLPQRGIGPSSVRMPAGWTTGVKGRIRPHPGKAAGKPLEDDLAQAGRVVTWGSGAAVKALMWGIPVDSRMPGWVAEQDNTDGGRLAMFRRLAWCTWRLSEIRSGEAFRWLLRSPA